MTALNTLRWHYSHQAAITRTRNTWDAKRHADHAMRRADRIAHLAKLLELAQAHRITWRQHTDHDSSGGGIDGSLRFYSQSGAEAGKVALDTYTPDEKIVSTDPACSRAVCCPCGRLNTSIGYRDITPGGVGVTVARGADMADHRDAVRAWCRLMLGRDDVEFEG